MKKTLKILGILVGLILVAFGALSAFVATMDADKYRPQLIAALTKQTGRAVKMDGPIGFSLGLGGVHVSVRDAAIANPVGASRPWMAQVGNFEVGVGLLPLLAHRVSVNQLTIENADILLETSATGQHNWDMGAAKTPDAAVPAPVNEPTTASSSVASGASVRIEHLRIVNSQLALRDAAGKTSKVAVSDLDIAMGATGALLSFKGDANGTPIVMTLKTGLTDLLGRDPFPFDLDLVYDNLHLTSTGTLDIGASKAEIAAYELSAGKSKITGDVAATWGGARPTLRGSLNSAHLDPADFKPSSSTTTPEPAAQKMEAPASAGAKRMFSDAPLPLAALQAADADLAVAVDEFPLGTDSLKKVTAKLSLAGGVLNLSPVKAVVGGAPMEFQLKLDAAQTPAHLSVGVMGQGVDLGDLQKLGGMSPFMTGKAGANIQLTGAGKSAHDIAASLGGIVTVTAEKGEILTGAAANISSSLAALFGAGTGSDAALNCLAARFIVKDGVMADNGILIDSATSTVAGKGNVNLGAETVDLALHARTKLVDVGGLVPALQVGGTLTQPTYKVDAAGMVKNVIGSLVNGSGDGLDSTVPAIQTASGQNACIYTLDHPVKASTSTVLPADAAGKASQKIQNLSKSLLKGLFGQ